MENSFSSVVTPSVDANDSCSVFPSPTDAKDEGEGNEVQSGDNNDSSPLGDRVNESNVSEGDERTRTYEALHTDSCQQKGDKIRPNHRVAVYCRVRAFRPEEKTGKDAELAVQMKEGTVEVTDPNKGQFLFSFNGCFWSCDNRKSAHHQRAATQEDVFDEVGRRLVENVLGGYNGLFMAYGPTGGGKTYTTYGPAESLGTDEEGLVPRACNMIFSRAAVSEQKGVRYTVRAFMVEVYLDQIYDLFNNRAGLQLRNNAKDHSYKIEGVKKISVTSYAQIQRLLKKANELRTFAETKIHNHSSRAHTLFTLEVEAGTCADEQPQWCGRLLIADLAGSERIREAGTEEGIGFEQARNINLSLLNLGILIDAIATRSSRGTQDIPEFRKGTLNKLLKDYLGGNSVSVMLIAIAPSARDAHLTVQALRIGNNAKKITTNAKINLVGDSDDDDDDGTFDADMKELFRQKKEALRGEIRCTGRLKKNRQAQSALEFILMEDDSGNEGEEYSDPSRNVDIENKQKQLREEEFSIQDELGFHQSILYGPYIDQRKELEQTLNSNADEFQKQLTSMENENDALREETTAQIQSLMDINANYEVKCRQQHQRLAEQSQSLEKKRADLTTLRILQEDTQNKLTDALAVLENVEKELEDTRAVRDTKEQQLTESQQHLAKTEGALQETQQQLTETANTLEEATKKLLATVALKDEIQKKLHESEGTLEETSTDLCQTKAALEETQQEVRKKANCLEDTSNQLVATVQSIDEIEERERETEVSLRDTGNELCQTKAALEETQHKVTREINTVVDTTNKLSAAVVSKLDRQVQINDSLEYVKSRDPIMRRLELLAKEMKESKIPEENAVGVALTQLFPDVFIKKYSKKVIELKLFFK